MILATTENIMQTNTAAVSYTHLDVYKRQYQFLSFPKQLKLLTCSRNQSVIIIFVFLGSLFRNSITFVFIVESFVLYCLQIWYSLKTNFWKSDSVFWMTNKSSANNSICLVICEYQGSLDVSISLGNVRKSMCYTVPLSCLLYTSRCV